MNGGYQATYIGTRMTDYGRLLTGSKSTSSAMCYTEGDWQLSADLSR